MSEKNTIDLRHISEWSQDELTAHVIELADEDFVDGFSRAAMLELVRRLKASEGSLPGAASAPREGQE